MKKLLMFSCAMLLLFGIVGAANATLWDRGGGLIYDDVLNITWLQDASYTLTLGYPSNGEMAQWAAIDWAEDLEYYDSVRAVTWDDWRLPDAYNQDGSLPDEGFNVTGSEMGHMFYINLGGSGGSFCGADFTDGNGDSVSFQGLQSYIYWSGTRIVPTSTEAWFFNFENGAQSSIPHYLTFAVWAVRDGDVAVPEPATMLLLGFGLMGLAGIRRKFKK